MNTISIELVRAQDVPALSIVRFAESVYYVNDAPRSRDNPKGGWKRPRYEGEGVYGWAFVYDVDNGQGDEDGQKLMDELSDEFTLFRVASDKPDSFEHDHRYVAIERHQLIQVQVVHDGELARNLIQAAADHPNG